MLLTWGGKGSGASSGCKANISSPGRVINGFIPPPASSVSLILMQAFVQNEMLVMDPVLASYLYLDFEFILPFLPLCTIRKGKQTDQPLNSA